VVAFAVPAQAAPSAEPRAQGGVTVGTFNINASQRFGVWRNAIREFRTHVQVAGLQEVNSDQKRHFLRSSRWGAFWPAKLGQNPVIWDRQAFEMLAARGAKLAKGRYVGNEKPGADPYRKASWATVVRLRHVRSGRTISVVNTHLVAGGVNGGRRIPGNPRLYNLYVDQMAGLARTVRTERSWAGGRVFVVGDFNVNYPADKKRRHANLPYALLTGAGLVSAWEARREIEPGHGSGTRGGAYLDGVWSSRGARRVSVMRSINVSDHFPVIATYAPPA
jgi:endonuclease/exonuclease/phosphatase family metal-dependent hydrolase